MSFSGFDASGEWRDQLLPVRLVLAEAARREGLLDQYISIAQFRSAHRRTADRVMSFGATAIELDQHAHNECDGESLWQVVRAFLDQTKIPLPTVVVASGRGLHLWWAYDRRIPGKAAPRWRALQSALVDKLKRFGADPTCVDAARLLRLPGTINSKTGTAARIIWCSEHRFDFEDLFCAAIPFTRSHLKRRRAARTKNAERRSRSPSTQLRTWQTTAIRDLRRLACLRGGFRRNIERNKAVFIASTLFAQFLAGDYSAAVLDFGRETTDLDDGEIRRAADSAMKKRLLDGRGYLYSRARIIRELDISPEEAQRASLALLLPNSNPSPERKRARC